MRYVISYDLVVPGRNYNTLITALESWGAQRILMSQWVVRWNGTSAQSIFNLVRANMDANDRLLVTCLDSSDWWSINLLANPNAI